MIMSSGLSGRPKPRAAQFELMVSFMERHGDISNYNNQDRLENLQNWSKLTELLNSETFGYPKPVNKWRKCWSDFKNNTKKKLERIKRGEVKVELTDLEKRLLAVLKNNENMERKASESDDNDPIQVKKEIELELCDRTLSSPPTSPDFFPEPKSKGTRCRKSSATSSASTSSGRDSIPLKRRKQLDGVNDITEKYIEFEREKEKMLHEREMARIRQNDQLFTIFGRIVSVLETLAPTIQRYLDRNSNIIEE